MGNYRHVSNPRRFIGIALKRARYRNPMADKCIAPAGTEVSESLYTLARADGNAEAN